MILNIIKQFLITFIIFIIKINVRLIRASQFFRQFRFNIKYKFDKKYIMLNSFSRLVNIIKSLLLINYLKLNVLYICVT